MVDIVSLTGLTGSGAFPLEMKIVYGGGGFQKYKVRLKTHQTRQ